MSKLRSSIASQGRNHFNRQALSAKNRYDLAVRKAKNDKSTLDKDSAAVSEKEQDILDNESRLRIANAQLDKKEDELTQVEAALQQLKDEIQTLQGELGSLNELRDRNKEELERMQVQLNLDRSAEANDQASLQSAKQQYLDTMRALLESWPAGLEQDRQKIFRLIQQSQDLLSKLNDDSDAQDLHQNSMKLFEDYFRYFENQKQSVDDETDDETDDEMNGESMVPSSPRTAPFSAPSSPQRALPEGWTSAEDPASGQTYYISPEGVSQWENPVTNNTCTGTDCPAQPAQNQSGVYKDSVTNQDYLYDTESGSSIWLSAIDVNNLTLNQLKIFAEYEGVQPSGDLSKKETWIDALEAAGDEDEDEAKEWDDLVNGLDSTQLKALVSARKKGIYARQLQDDSGKIIDGRRKPDTIREAIRKRGPTQLPALRDAIGTPAQLYEPTAAFDVKLWKNRGFQKLMTGTKTSGTYYTRVYGKM
jgi:hypothetical protein